MLMKDIIKQNLNDEVYIETLINRVISQRNEALNNVALLEAEILKANLILQRLTEEIKELKEQVILNSSKE
jgi:hypothetical protein